MLVYLFVSDAEYKLVLHARRGGAGRRRAAQGGAANASPMTLPSYYFGPGLFAADDESALEVGNHDS